MIDLIRRKLYLSICNLYCCCVNCTDSQCAKLTTMECCSIPLLSFGLVCILVICFRNNNLLKPTKLLLLTLLLCVYMYRERERMCVCVCFIVLPVALTLIYLYNLTWPNFNHELIVKLSNFHFITVKGTRWRK